MISVGAQIGNLIATRDNNPNGLMFWWAFNMWAWAAVTWLLFIVDWLVTRSAGDGRVG